MKVKSKLNMVLRELLHRAEMRRKYPIGTDEVIEINRIVIPQYFKESIPSTYKMERYKQRFVEKGYIDKPISVHRDLKELDDSIVFLSDGYIRYLICKDNGLKFVPIRYDERNSVWKNK